MKNSISWIKKIIVIEVKIKVCFASFSIGLATPRQYENFAQHKSRFF